MGAITLHGLDEDLDRRLRQKAREEGRSINKTAKDLLRKSLGIAKDRPDHRADFADLFGTWSNGDVSEFERATSSLRKVDAEDWG